MNIMEGCWIAKNKKGEYWTNIRGYDEHITDQTEIDYVAYLKRIFASKNYDEVFRRNEFYRIREEMSSSDEVRQKIAEAQRIAQAAAQSACSQLIMFFNEFDFAPNFRFVNTLGRIAVTASLQDCRNYVCNYFKLTDNPNIGSIQNKVKSAEFEQIYNTLKDAQTRKIVNARFRLYYGTQGTGKTTLAMKEADGNCMVCHSAMLPSDLMEDFKFENGQPNFTPSALQRAMVEGKTIVLDEINLLPFESLRFLQSILDGKSEFVYKGQTIKIADGFKIIGTMNLQVNGMVYALPEPLVDRAECLREFKLNADDLMGALV